MNGLACVIRQRVSAAGHPFSELFITFTDAQGMARCAYSRVWYVIDDTPHARAAQLEAFRKRAARW